ncbi:hypothetical protein [Bradyrhizobium sp. DASA03007]|uniref:hypothetical protein n=1 Tax=unclassified Bradyrhizobium TaxID=2631580 RepID=UPI003F6ECE5E
MSTLSGKIGGQNADVARPGPWARSEGHAAPPDRGPERLATERGQLVAMEAKKARDAAAAELMTQTAEAAELRQNLESNNAKLAKVQQAQAELIRKQRALDEDKRELNLIIQQRVQVPIGDIQAKTRQEADEPTRLRKD